MYLSLSLPARGVRFSFRHLSPPAGEGGRRWWVSAVGGRRPLLPSGGRVGPWRVSDRDGKKKLKFEECHICHVRRWRVDYPTFLISSVARSKVNGQMGNMHTLAMNGT